jgi:hypothetical protein
MNETNNNDAIICSTCHQTLSKNEFPEFPRKRCRQCNKERVAKLRGKGDDIQRMLFQLRHQCNQHHWEEGLFWDKRDVETLLARWVPPTPELAHAVETMGVTPKFKIIKMDESKPMLPDNAGLKIVGKKLV